MRRKAFQVAEQQQERKIHMHSILEDLADGRITPEARSCAKDARYRKAMELTVRHEKHLAEELRGNDKDIFEKLLDAQAEASQYVESNAFIYGFKLGLMIAAEAFLTMDDLCVSGKEI
jgi:hypothetical protein